MISWLAYIPPPTQNSIGFVRIYGITMALGIGVGTIIAHKRYTKWHPESQVVIEFFFPTVVAGIVGARVYLLFTGYDWDGEGIAGVIKLRNGGLSIWGAVIAGALAVFIQARWKKVSFFELGAAIIPGLAVAQAIGRVGNYFNQELYGRPLNAFWALKVETPYRPWNHLHQATYHPTFLYEALWCLFIAGVVLLLEKKVRLWSHSASIAFYVAAYCWGRAVFEHLRIDNASKLFGVRFNLLLSLTLATIGTIWLITILIRNAKVHAEVATQ